MNGTSASKPGLAFSVGIIDPLPQALRADLAACGAKAWPDVEAIIATAEPYNGRSPWAMRAEAL